MKSIWMIGKYRALVLLGLLSVYSGANATDHSWECMKSKEIQQGWGLNAMTYVYASPEKSKPIGVIHPGANILVCSDGISKDNWLKVESNWVNFINHPDKPHNINGWISSGTANFAYDFKKGTVSQISGVAYAWGDVAYNWEIQPEGILKECVADTYVSMKQTCKITEWYQHKNDKILLGSRLLISDPVGSWCFVEDMMLTGFCDENGLVEIKYDQDIVGNSKKKIISGVIALKLKNLMENSHSSDDYYYINHFSNDIQFITAKGKLLNKDQFHKLDSDKKSKIMCGIDYSFSFFKWEAVNDSPRWMVNTGRRTITTPPYVEVGEYVVLNYGRIWLRPIENGRLEIFRVFLDDTFGCG